MTHCVLLWSGPLRQYYTTFDADRASILAGGFKSGFDVVDGARSQQRAAPIRQHMLMRPQLLTQSADPVSKGPHPIE
jgi:hypothetical protein